MSWTSNEIHSALKYLRNLSESRCDPCTYQTTRIITLPATQTVFGNGTDCVTLEGGPTDVCPGDTGYVTVGHTKSYTICAGDTDIITVTFPNPGNGTTTIAAGACLTLDGLLEGVVLDYANVGTSPTAQVTECQSSVPDLTSNSST